MAESQQFQNATDFELKSVSIAALGSDDAYEIKQMIGTFSYVESVTSPFVAATMTVADSAGLLNDLPIQGGETVQVVIQSSITEEPVQYNMNVWKIGNRNTKNKTQSYTLGLVSAEALNNEVTRLFKPVSGTGDKIVKDVLDTLGTEKEFFSETTEFEMKMIPANRRPFDLISTISVKSVPKGAVGSTSDKKSKSEKNKVNGSAGFFFWETKRGYNYYSVDYLMDQADDAWGPYIEKISNMSDGADERMTISQAVFRSEVDIMTSLRTGKYSTLLVFFNHATGQYDEYHYSLEDAYENMKHLGAQNKPSILPAGEDKKVSDYPTRIVTSLLDHESWYNKPDIGSYEENDGSENPSPYCDFHKHFAAQSLMRYELLKHQQATVVIPGNPEICAGDAIQIKLVNKGTDERINEEPWDPESSGVYLVSEVTHTYDSTQSTNGRFVTTLRLMRDSYGDIESNHGTK